MQDLLNDISMYKQPRINSKKKLQNLNNEIIKKEKEKNNRYSTRNVTNNVQRNSTSINGL